MSVRTFCFFILTLLIPTLAFCATTSATEPTNEKKWRQDIDYLQQQLEARHINLYHRISKEDFTRQLADVKQQLPNLSPAQLMVRLMRVVKQVGDGHTQFNYWGSRFHRYPLTLKQVGGELRVVEISPTQQQLLGTKLHSINGITTANLIASLKPVLQGVENSFSEQHWLTQTITVAEVLEGLDITKPGRTASFSFADDKGTLQSITLTASLPDTYKLVALPRDLPAGFSEHDLSIPELSLWINKPLRTAYLDFKRYPRFFEMDSFAKKLGKLLVQEQIRNVVIDFRHNGGGDFFVGLILAWGLIVVDSLDWQGGMYVLIGRETYSASMSNAAQYRQILNARLVGEPSGSNPIGYQDAETFILPNSGWKVMHSKRLYRFQDTPTAGLQPDVYLPEDWVMTKQGKDNQLGWILRDIQNRQTGRAQQ